MIRLPLGKVLGGHRELAAFVLLATAVPLAFALYTQHIWEDFFITFRHSMNLCHGHGLVYQAGERVHGFTSPLGVLVPALCYLTCGQTSYVPALWLFRLISIAAFAGGGALTWRALQRDEQRWRLLKLLFPLLFVCESKSVDFSVNGMETGLMLLFAGWAVYLLEADGPRVWLARGVCWAGLMWTRPDGFVFAGALALGMLMFQLQRRVALVRSFLASALVAAVLYLPWLAWAWSYYGSPVPNTVRAKAPFVGDDFTTGWLLLRLYTHFPHRAADIFLPNCSWTWAGVTWLPRFGYGLGIFCALYWLLPLNDRLGRTASLGFFLATLYFSYLDALFGWYAPPAALLGLVTLARGGYCVVEAVVRHRLLSRLVTAGALGGVCVGMGWVLVMTAQLMKIQQRQVEQGNREAIGLWLRDHVRPRETVFLEPLGYIGFFSNARMLDWPGLVAPPVIQARKNGLTFVATAAALQPDWTVLRAWEKDGMFQLWPGFREHYILVKQFDVGAQLQRYQKMPGWAYMDLDAHFWVFHKTTVSEESPHTAQGGGDRPARLAVSR
jgi:hypothetical protein